MFDRRSIVAAVCVVMFGIGPAAAGELTLRGTLTTPGAGGVAQGWAELLPLLDGYQTGRMRLEKALDPPPVATAAAAPSGRFVLNVPEPGMWKVVVGAPGFVPMQLDPLLVLESEQLPPVSLLPDAGAVFAARRASGEALPGVWLFADSASEEVWKGVSANGWRPQSRVGLTDEEGRLALPRAPDERLDVSVLVSGSAGEKQAGVTGGPIQVSPQARWRRTIEVRDPNGSPLEGILVRAGDLAWPVGLTGRDGRLRIAAGSREKVRIWLFTPEGRRQVEVLEPAADPPREPVVLTFEAPARFSGHVVDGVTRRPLAGAVVWPGYEPANFDRTDAAGGYELFAPGRQPLWLQAEAPGYVPVAQKVTAGEPGLNQAPILTLMPAAAAGGRVTDPEGGPIAGARIVAMARGRADQRRAFRHDRAAGRAVTGADGRFHLSGLSANASYELRVTREGFSTTVETLRGLEPFKTSPPLRIVLRRSRGAYGWVVGMSEQPLAGAEVTVSAAAEARKTRRRDRGAPGALQAATDPNGRFEIADIPGLELDLTVQREGFAPSTVRGIAVPPGKGPVDLGTVILEPGVTLAGMVTDAQKQPIADAEVALVENLDRSEHALMAQARRREPDATTDAAGRFVVGQLRRRERFDLVVRRSGYLPASLRGIKAPTAEPVTVVLRAAARVAGEVVDEEGRPIAGAEVDCQSRGEGEAEGWPRMALGAYASTVSDEVGGFVIEDVLPGPAEIRVYAQGFQPATVPDLEIRPGTTLEGLEIVLERGAVLEGRVSTSDGEPIAQARVMAGASSAFSDAEGAYRVAGLLLGSQSIKVEHRHYGFLAEELEVEPGANTLDLTYPTAHAVTGRVVDQAGWPVTGAGVSLTSEVGDWRELRASTGEDGSFLLSPVADGEYTLRAEHEDYAASRLAERIVVAGGPVRDLEVELTPGGTIRGRILGLDFEQLTRVEIWARKGKEQGKHGKVDYEGNYVVSPLAPGDWRVRATLRGGSRQVVERVPLGRDEEVVSRDLVFGADLNLTGRVIYANEPLAGAQVFLRGHDVAANRSVTTDHEGHFEIRDLKPGSYRLQATGSELGAAYNQELDLFADRDLLIEITAARIRGQVVEASSSAPIPAAWVIMKRMAGAEDAEAAFLIALATEPDGSFHIPKVTPGRYRLSVRKDGYAAVEQTLTVEPGLDVDNLRLELTETTGLTLEVRLASGRRPRHVSVGLVDSAGRAVNVESRNLDAAGRARFSTVPPGTWKLLLSAPGGATTTATAVVPGEPVPVVMAEGGELRVRIRELTSSDHIATLRLTRADGRPFRGLTAQGIRDRWPVIGGQATIAALPPGVWTLNVLAPDGAAWAGSVVAAAGQVVPVTCTAGQCFSGPSPESR